MNKQKEKRMLETLKKNKVEIKSYTKKEPVFQDGEYWYIQPGDGNRRRVASHAKKNTTRMFVNGKYISKTHPLHKPGRYKSLDDAWSHNKIESINEGEVYAIGNKAWPDWVKIGKAVDADDRLNGYQKSSPFRDYFVITKIKTDNRHDAERKMHRLFDSKAKERNNEWFKITSSQTKDLFDGFRTAS